jgi:hypothetical protein
MKTNLGLCLGSRDSAGRQSAAPITMAIPSGGVVMDEQAKDEVLAAYAAYVAAFRANDVRAIDKLMQYPFSHIGNGQTTLLDAYPIRPAEMRAA